MDVCFDPRTIIELCCRVSVPSYAWIGRSRKNIPRIKAMTAHLIASATLSALLFAGNGPGDEFLKSGPPVGARNNRGGFFPNLVAGPGAGERRCPV
jgi:hypothetical protein